ncbi:MAG: orotidine 5'-phosphate decarboxylase [Candidatus Doudnabacteria bacterium RIFCSPHIGHO2_01_FULL_46_14]|uniref:Orotidine-5'-phosphate decarboxylase n=1 Tax=Candidatus Doudnabacteria bacterium RIFCSPHIGHO2_01_FULL_46_14 TaxID=1817824 RepID=A0A1F5NMW2_9BACT|nr:MAG: orotidine 5'-phosphate decarboxylase [Candidatus Doudnabacteria bacterium RIFCSPHIGHO2_01_FULL_46_14]
MNPIDRYNSCVDEINSLLCVGLDSDLTKLPQEFQTMSQPQLAFNRYIINETHKYAAAYKLNLAFYESRGESGITELKLTMDYLHKKHPEIFTICDAKRADIGNTNAGYVTAFFDYFGFDAITLHPYLGREALQPFLVRYDKVSIILCRTSNTGAGEFQDLISNEKPLWQIVAEKVSSEWNENQNCMLVVGATYPAELKKVREITGDMTLLVPGIGAQGGDVKAAVEAGLNSEKKGMIINAARSIIFAKDPGKEAKKLRDEINQYRNV